MSSDAVVKRKSPEENSHAAQPGELPLRTNSNKSDVLPPGQLLTGKQEHCMQPLMHVGSRSDLR